MREKHSIFGAAGIAATNFLRWSLRMKSRSRTLKSPSHSLQAWWLNEAAISNTRWRLTASGDTARDVCGIVHEKQRTQISIVVLRYVADGVF